MKKLKLFAFFAAFALIFSGCSKDLEDLIVGKWNIDEMKVSITYEGVTDDETDKNIGTLEFKSDGNGESIITMDGETETESFKWSATDDDKLIIEGEKWDVTTKKKKEMVLENSTSMMGMDIEVKLTLSK